MKRYNWLRMVGKAAIALTLLSLCLAWADGSWTPPSDWDARTKSGFARVGGLNGVPTHWVTLAESGKIPHYWLNPTEAMLKKYPNLMPFVTRPAKLRTIDKSVLARKPYKVPALGWMSFNTRKTIDLILAQYPDTPIRWDQRTKKWFAFGWVPKGTPINYYIKEAWFRARARKFLKDTFGYTDDTIRLEEGGLHETESIDLCTNFWLSVFPDWDVHEYYLGKPEQPPNRPVPPLELFLQGEASGCCAPSQEWGGAASTSTVEEIERSGRDLVDAWYWREREQTTITTQPQPTATATRPTPTATATRPTPTATVRPTPRPTPTGGTGPDNGQHGDNGTVGHGNVDPNTGAQGNANTDRSSGSDKSGRHHRPDLELVPANYILPSQQGQADFQPSWIPVPWDESLAKLLVVRPVFPGAHQSIQIYRT